MVKSLIFCILINCFLLAPTLAQNVQAVQDDSLGTKGILNYYAKPENRNFEKRVTGYSGIATTGTQTAYFGGLNYALRDNMSLRFDMFYGSGNSFLFQPYSNSRIIAPSLLYEYTFIGKSGSHSPYGYTNGSDGFTLYGFTGIGGQMFTPGVSPKSAEYSMQGPYSKSLNIVVPLGLGMQYKFDNNMTIGLEIRGNFHISNGGFYDPNSYGINSFHNSLGQWGYPGVMNRQFGNGPGF